MCSKMGPNSNLAMAVLIKCKMVNLIMLDFVYNSEDFEKIKPDEPEAI